MTERAGVLRDLRTASNRGVERAHTRLAREHSKANLDVRQRRMDALKVCLNPLLLLFLPLNFFAMCYCMPKCTSYSIL